MSLNINNMRKPWSREETIVAFYVYCKVPFKESGKENPIIRHYAQILGRSPSALNMKVGNIGRLDPDLRKKGITGLRHGARMEKEVWKEFSSAPERLAYESERIIAELQGKTLEERMGLDTHALPSGKEREAVVKQRVNQQFFRTAVLSAYNNKCCVSGVGSTELLEACHIVDWGCDSVNRTNPKNGLCMNPFFHKAYDKLLIGISPNLVITISDELLTKTYEGRFLTYLKGLQGRKITMPDRFLPEKDFLQMRYEQFKKR